MKRNLSLKKISSVFVVLALLIQVLVFSGCSNSEVGKNGTLVVANYGLYIEEDVIEAFEKETGIDIQYEEFQTPEEMYAKFISGAIKYDVMCTSDYMIEKMISEDLLLEIDYDNFSNIDNIGDKYWDFSKAFDPELKYTVPYFWGTLGLLYNTETVDPEKIKSWNVLWDEDYSGKIIITDSIRDAFVAPLKLLGESINTQDQAILDQAQQMLIDQKPLVYSYVVDEAKDEVISGSVDIAIIYSGEAFAAHEENDKLNYIIPEEGSNVWVDSWFIPNTCQNKTGAEQFLDYLCKAEVAKQNFEYVEYPSPNVAFLEMLDSEMLSNELIFPSEEVLDKCEAFVGLSEETVAYYSTLWKELKAN